MPIHYWDDVISFPTLQATPAQDIIAKLKNHHAYHEVTLKKLSAGDVYSARVNKKGRLLFKTAELNNQRCLVAIAYVPEHDIDRIYLNWQFVEKRMQRHHAALLEQVEQDVDEAEAQAIFEACRSTDDAEQSKRISYINGQFIDWNDCQQQIDQQSLPLIINGVPGSGKTILLLNRLLRLQNSHEIALKLPASDDNDSDCIQSTTVNARYVYVAESALLVDEISRQWHANPSVNPSLSLVEFVDYESFIRAHSDLTGKTLVGFAEFESYIESKKLQFNRETAYQELLLIAFCHYDEAAYFARGMAAAHYHEPEQKRELVELAIAYRDYCAANQQVDLNLVSVDLERCVDVLVLDEGQDLSAMKVRSLLSCLRDHDSQLPQVMVGCDTHQCLKQAKPNYPFLKELLSSQHLNVFNLAQSYRLANKPAGFCSDLVELSLHLTRGKSNNHEYHKIVSANNQSDDGVIEWITLPKSKRLPAKQLERLKSLLASANVAVVVPDEAMRREVKALLNPRLCLTVAESKGQEFDLVIAYGLLASATYQPVYTKIPSLDDGINVHLHSAKDKTDTAHLTFGRAMHELLVAMSRGRRGTLWIESAEHKTRHLAKYCQTRISQYQSNVHAEKEEPIAIDSASTTKEAWLAQAEALIVRGLLIQAREIIEQTHDVKLAKELNEHQLRDAIAHPYQYQALPDRSKQSKKAEKSRDAAKTKFDKFCRDKIAIKKWLLDICKSRNFEQAIAKLYRSYKVKAFQKYAETQLFQGVMSCYYDALLWEDLEDLSMLFNDALKIFTSALKNMLDLQMKQNPVRVAKILFGRQPEGVNEDLMKSKHSFTWNYFEGKQGLVRFKVLAEADALQLSGVIEPSNYMLRVGVLTLLMHFEATEYILELMSGTEGKYLYSLFSFEWLFSENDHLLLQILLSGIILKSQIACVYFIRQLSTIESNRWTAIERRSMRSYDGGYPLITNAELNQAYALFQDFCSWNKFDFDPDEKMYAHLRSIQAVKRDYNNNNYLPKLREAARQQTLESACEVYRSIIKVAGGEPDILTDFMDDTGNNLFFESLQDPKLFAVMLRFLDESQTIFTRVKQQLCPYHVYHLALKKPLLNEVIRWFREHFYTLNFIQRIRWDDIKNSLQSASHYSTEEGDTMLPLAWLIFATADGDYSLVLQALFHVSFDVTVATYLPENFFNLTHPMTQRLRPCTLSCEGRLTADFESLTIQQLCLMMPVLQAKLRYSPAFIKKLSALDSTGCITSKDPIKQLAGLHTMAVSETLLPILKEQAHNFITQAWSQLDAEDQRFSNKLVVDFTTRKNCWEIFAEQYPHEPTLFQLCSKAPSMLTLVFAKLIINAKTCADLCELPVFNMLLPVDDLFNVATRVLCQYWTRQPSSSLLYYFLTATTMFNLFTLPNTPSTQLNMAEHGYFASYADLLLRVMHLYPNSNVYSLMDSVFAEDGVTWLQDLFRPEMLFIHPNLRCAERFKYAEPKPVQPHVGSENYNLAVNSLHSLLLSPCHDSLLGNLARLYGDKITIQNFAEKGALLEGLKQIEKGEQALDNLFQHFPRVKAQFEQLQQLNALLAIRQRQTRQTAEVETVEIEACVKKLG